MKRIGVALIVAGAFAVVPAAANAAPNENANENARTCATSSAGGEQKQARADLFFGGSVGALQQAHCGSEFRKP